MVKSRGTSEANTCVANLKQIDGAKEQWASENKRTTNDVPTWDDLVGKDKYIRNTPSCPAGGTLQINRVGQPPTCTFKDPKHPHVLPE
jgi:hypothetical protein